MNIDTSDYFSAASWSGWVESLFEPSEAKEGEKPQITDLGTSRPKSPRTLSDAEFAKLSSEEKKAYLKESIAHHERALSRLLVEQKSLKDYIRVLDKSIAPLKELKEKWQRRLDALPGVLKQNSPQAAHARKKINEIREKLNPLRRDRIEQIRRSKLIYGRISKTHSELEKLFAKNALSQ